MINQQSEDSIPWKRFITSQCHLSGSLRRLLQCLRITHFRITLKSTPAWHWSGGTAGTEGRPKSRVAEEDPAQKKREGIQARNAMGGGKPRPRPDKPRLVKPRPRQDRASTQWPLAGQRSGWIELTRTNKYPDSRMPQHYSYAVMQFEKGGYLDSSTLIESWLIWFLIELSIE